MGTRRSAEEGSAQAMCNLGWCYETGNGVEQSWEEAVQWYRRGAEEGSARAMCSLGWCYESGNGVEQSWEQAVYWYRRSAEEGQRPGDV